MRLRDSVIANLRARGELLTPMPGLVSLRGEALSRSRGVERRVAHACASLTQDEWQVPQALPLEVLERAEYFSSFPQWLTLASHLTDDECALEQLATEAAEAGHRTDAFQRATVGPVAALPPAVCYHVYATLARSTIHAPRIVTAQGCCWRHERERFTPLERGWAFTMREIVCVGTEAECNAFRERGIALAQSLAADLDVSGTVEQAEDPFFAPTARGRSLLQRIKGLKHELRLDVGDGDTVAAASFNLHERFFGEAFDIRLTDGSPAYTACVAFGLERWLLASLTAENRTAAASTLAAAAEYQEKT